MIIFTQDKQNEIMRMYKDGVCIDDILIHFNSDEHSIRKVLKENKIDRNYNFFSEELYDRIVTLYRLRYTQKAICHDLLISEIGIKRALLRKGINKRSSSECNRRYDRNQHYFDIIDTPNKTYILGLLYADGCNHTAHNAITLSLQEEDVGILEIIKNELEYTGSLRLSRLNDKNINYKNQYILCINDEYLSARLADLGVVNAKSLKLTFPEFLNQDLLRHFVRGYFDGDGCVYYDEKTKKVPNSNRRNNRFL